MTAPKVYPASPITHAHTAAPQRLSSVKRARRCQPSNKDRARDAQSDHEAGCRGISGV